MKSAYVCLLIFFLMIALPGCGGSKENTLATDNATEDAIAKYEADLALANAEGSYDDENAADSDESSK